MSPRVFSNNNNKKSSLAFAVVLFALACSCFDQVRAYRYYGACFSQRLFLGKCEKKQKDTDNIFK